MEKWFKGKIILKDAVFNGYISVENGIIRKITELEPEEDFVDFGGFYIAPGLIDIHCHSSFDCAAFENPEEVADFHLAHGVTSMLLTIYRDVPHEKILSAFSKIEKAMELKSNILGVHMEGPFISDNLGYVAADRKPIENAHEIFYQYLHLGREAGNLRAVLEYIPSFAGNGGRSMALYVRFPGRICHESRD